MSKLQTFTTVLVLVAAGVAIASLVLNIIILGKVDKTSDVSPTDTSTPTNDIGGATCPSFDQVSQDPMWKEAADRLLASMDESIDPCEDFYQFSCGKYLEDTQLGDESRKGNYDEAQLEINTAIAAYLDSFGKKKPSMVTEQIELAYYQQCYSDHSATQTPAIVTQKMNTIHKDVLATLGFPFVGIASVPTDTPSIFTTMGNMERQYIGGPFLTSIVTADYGNAVSNALFVSQPNLAFARDYYVLPQYIADLQDYADDIELTLTSYFTENSLKPKCAAGVDCTTKALAQKTVDIERMVAMASWPDTEMRNYQQQYNPLTLANIDKRFPSLSISSYVNALIDGLGIDFSTENVVITQPTYFAGLDSLFADGKLSQDDIVNYLTVQFIYQSVGSYGPDLSATDGKARTPEKRYRDKGQEPYSIRRGRGARGIAYRPINAAALTDDEEQQIKSACINEMIDLIPYSVGYTYAVNVVGADTTNAILPDLTEQTVNIITAFTQQINSLDWMTDESKTNAYAKADQLVKNYLFPEWFSDPATVDAYHVDYKPILDVDNYWDALKGASYGMETREFFKYLGEPADRTNFLASPAVVNAWYQPERNSITFPLGILNPPYYNLAYPQAYNYAGQGGTGGHELTHGFDDEGVQFGPTGQLVNCTFTHCGILDDTSLAGFTDMAQCVVNQYNMQCCPLTTGNVRCANGATTQGENIADIGGQETAYRAYGNWTAVHGIEKRLPGLESYSPQQIFWITYGVSWCMKLTDQRLVKQLLTDPHAPSSCRVNQVMQDMPKFGSDWKCKKGSPMYPDDDDRCTVWIGSL